MAHLGFVIDAKNCIACHSCAVACKVENNLPDDNWWNRIITIGGDNRDTPSGTYNVDLKMDVMPIACQHCENPACVKACPVGATYKDPETGAVKQDYDRCIGCRMCMASCPYTGVRSFNWDEPRHYTGVDMGAAGIPAHQKHTVEKCIMCSHRLDRGLEPACVEPCPSRIRYFGDFDDPDSEVSRLIATREYKTLLPEKGTKPSVYYLV